MKQMKYLSIFILAMILCLNIVTSDNIQRKSSKSKKVVKIGKHKSVALMAMVLHLSNKSKYSFYRAIKLLRTKCGKKIRATRVFHLVNAHVGGKSSRSHTRKMLRSLARSLECSALPKKLRSSSRKLRKIFRSRKSKSSRKSAKKHRKSKSSRKSAKKLRKSKSSRKSAKKHRKSKSSRKSAKKHRKSKSSRKSAKKHRKSKSSRKSAKKLRKSAKKHRKSKSSRKSAKKHRKSKSSRKSAKKHRKSAKKHRKSAKKHAKRSRKSKSSRKSAKRSRKSKSSRKSKKATLRHLIRVPKKLRSLRRHSRKGGKRFYRYLKALGQLIVRLLTSVHVVHHVEHNPAPPKLNQRKSINVISPAPIKTPQVRRPSFQPQTPQQLIPQFLF